MQEMLWRLTNTGGYPGFAKQARSQSTSLPSYSGGGMSSVSGPHSSTLQGLVRC